MKVRYISDVHKMDELTEKEKKEFDPIQEKFAFRTNSYYNSLIDWDDPDDPLRRIIIPSKEENVEWGELDASSEHKYQVAPGLEHKYKTTALLLCNDVCAAYCRFCFRKRLFQNENEEVEKDVSQGIQYIREHEEINNVLLTGGDPLSLSTRRLRDTFESLSEIKHVKIVRLGTKVLGFNPFRVLNDEAFVSLIEEFSQFFQINFMLHYNHPRELTEESLKAVRMIKRAGANTVNQTPIIRGVNDDPEVLRELLEKLSFNGIQPYYVFGCRPTEGNMLYSVPMEEAFLIYQDARKKVSGLAKTARFVMSHSSGKIEIMGIHNKKVLMKKYNYHNCDENEEVMIFNSNPEAHWLDDYLNEEEKVEVLEKDVL
jgi:lysine 2,3-aminomutase